MERTWYGAVAAQSGSFVMMPVFIDVQLAFVPGSFKYATVALYVYLEIPRICLSSFRRSAVG